MNKQLELLLELEELALLRGARQLSDSSVGSTSECLEQRIGQLRRRVPGTLLSRFDHLAREYANAISPVVNAECQCCHHSLSPHLAHRLRDGSQIIQCDFCGRFLVSADLLPDYLP